MSTSAAFSFEIPARSLGGEARREERAEFERLVTCHSASIYRLALRLTESPADAEDLVQETFLRAWRGIRRFRGESRYRTWLVRILLNAAANRRRALGRAAPPEPPPGPNGDPAEATVRRELLRRVLDAVQALPRRQRETILLRARGGLSLDEIAEVLGIGKGVVKVHLHRARRKLLRRFGPEIGGVS